MGRVPSDSTGWVVLEQPSSTPPAKTPPSKGFRASERLMVSAPIRSSLRIEERISQAWTTLEKLAES